MQRGFCFSLLPSRVAPDSAKSQPSVLQLSNNRYLFIFKVIDPLESTLQMWGMLLPLKQKSNFSAFYPFIQDWEPVAMTLGTGLIFVGLFYLLLLNFNVIPFSHSSPSILCITPWLPGKTVAKVMWKANYTVYLILLTGYKTKLHLKVGKLGIISAIQ